IDRGTQWILENHERVRRGELDALYNNWGHAYGIQGMVRLYRRAGEKGDEALQKKLRAAIASQIEKLDRYEYLNGGWGYYDFDHTTQFPTCGLNSFTTATAFVALHEAAEVGEEVAPKVSEKALASVDRQRNPDFTYAYGEYLRMRPRMTI